MSRKYNMIVLDIDGTVTDSSKKITEKTREALIEAQKRGIYVVLASGRPTYGIKALADELELDVYGGFVLSFNGGKVTDWKTKEVIFEQPLPADRLDEVCRLSRKHKVSILTYKNQSVITEQPEDPYVQLEGRTVGMSLLSVVDLAQYVDFPVVKCMMLAEGEYLARVEPLVREELGEGFNVYRSEPYFLEIMAEGIDKAASLGRLLEHLNMSREEMICCGDGLNDVTMIEYAGLGVAMENAAPEVKKVADFVTRSNDEDGVAFVIEQFLTD